jgi:hypothetical protein
LDDTLHWSLEILLNYLVGVGFGHPVAEVDDTGTECGMYFNSLPTLLLHVLHYVGLPGHEADKSIECLSDEAL